MAEHSETDLPDDFRSALEADPHALAVYRGVSDAYRVGLLTLLQHPVSEDHREERIALLIRTLLQHRGVDLVDKALGFELHQKNLPAAFQYSLSAADFDASGRPRKAQLVGNQSSDSPTGRLDVAYSGMRMILDSLMQTFNFYVEVQGPLSDPTGARLFQDQSGSNPGQLIQLVRKGVTGPRMVFTARNGSTSVAPEDGEHMDVLWKDIPTRFDLVMGRQNGGKRAYLFGDQPAGRPDSMLRLRQKRAGSRQELHLHGLAPRWQALVFVLQGALTDPRDIEVNVASTVRNPTDVVQLASYQDGNLTHSLVLKGGPDADVPVQAHAKKVDASYNKIPEALILRSKRVVENGKDRSQALYIQNARIIGGDLGNRDKQANFEGAVHAQFRTDSNPSEDVVLRDLPGETSMTFTRPRDGDADCLGGIAYQAGNSTVDMNLNLFLDEGCARGELTARITDMPADGFVVADIQKDGNGRIEVANGNSVKKFELHMKVPKDLKTFVNKDFQVPDEEFCKPFIFALGCIDITIDVKPEFKELEISVKGHDLTKAVIATNVGPDGSVDPYPGSSTRKEDRRLWELLPIFAVRNDGSGSITVKLDGEDDDSEDGNGLYQKVDCCTGPFKPSSTEDSISFDGAPLGVRFYSWIVRQGSCTGPSQSGPDPRKCNRAGAELRDDYGQNVHCGLPGQDPVPFAPKFIAFSSTKNALTSTEGTTMYYVPNLYDRFMSYDPSSSGRWYGYSAASTCQTDWFFAGLLREYEPDLLANSLD